jgi:hypothetical protein
MNCQSSVQADREKMLQLRERSNKHNIASGPKDVDGTASQEQVAQVTSIEKLARDDAICVKRKGLKAADPAASMSSASTQVPPRYAHDSGGRILSQRVPCKVGLLDAVAIDESP